MKKYIVQLRHGTAAEWESHSDIIPYDGELICVSTAAGQMLKVGDGVTPYSNLPFISAGSEGGGLSADTKAALLSLFATIKTAFTKVAWVNSTDGAAQTAAINAAIERLESTLTDSENYVTYSLANNVLRILDIPGGAYLTGGDDVSMKL